MSHVAVCEYYWRSFSQLDTDKWTKKFCRKLWWRRKKMRNSKINERLGSNFYFKFSTQSRFSSWKLDLLGVLKSFKKLSVCLIHYVSIETCIVYINSSFFRKHFFFAFLTPPCIVSRLCSSVKVSWCLYLILQPLFFNTTFLYTTEIILLLSTLQTFEWAESERINTNRNIFYQFISIQQPLLFRQQSLDVP